MSESSLLVEWTSFQLHMARGHNLPGVGLTTGDLDHSGQTGLIIDTVEMCQKWWSFQKCNFCFFVCKPSGVSKICICCRKGILQMVSNGSSVVLLKGQMSNTCKKVTKLYLFNKNIGILNDICHCLVLMFSTIYNQSETIA